MLKLDKNFLQRLFFGALLVGVIVLCILWQAKSFAILFAFLSALSTREFHTLMVRQGVSLSTDWGSIGSLFLFLGFYGYFAPCVVAWFSPLFLSFYGFWFVISFIVELYNKTSKPLVNLSYLVLGQIYVALPFALLSGLYFYGGQPTPVLVLALFVLIWTNDTFAYMTGSLFGKHRLFERISPKKSWEGFIGGNVFALAVSQIFAYYEPAISWWMWLVFAQFVVLSATYGDLIESLIKRNLGVKDSGHAIPGHGGFLDRFDSVLLASPVLFITLTLLQLLKQP